MPGPIGGVIFDLDGTLLNTLDDLASVMNGILLRHGFQQHPVSSYRYFVGDGLEMLVKRALRGVSTDSAVIARCQEEFISESEKHSGGFTVPYPGVAELLEDLSDRRIALTVLSNKPHELTVNTVRLYFSGTPFVAIVGDGIFPRKPSPDAALYLASVMGIEPRECLYMGDTGTDMKTATDAGMPSVGVLWGFRDEVELREHGARWTIDRPDELFEIIDNFEV